MCFSANASFAAAAVLSGIGAVSVRAAPTRRHLALAAIPLLFAAQQACEGALWIVLARAPYHVGGTPLARAFLFFALFVWPAYLPVALALVEPRGQRRAAMLVLAAGGFVLGAYLAACSTLRDANACVAYGSLYYWVQVDARLKPIVVPAYLAFVAGPLALSSIRGSSWLAAAAASSCVAIAAIDRAGFVSVWCFFAAALSGLVALVVTMERARARASRAP
ncbi:MAG TPA: DUF6629 family protein [Polyangiaceae bacterium]|jgi:hypothetical protein